LEKKEIEQAGVNPVHIISNPLFRQVDVEKTERAGDQTDEAKNQSDRESEARREEDERPKRDSGEHNILVLHYTILPTLCRTATNITCPLREVRHPSNRHTIIPIIHLPQLIRFAGWPIPERDEGDGAKHLRPLYVVQEPLPIRRPALSAVRSNPPADGQSPTDRQSVDRVPEVSSPNPSCAKV